MTTVALIIGALFAIGIIGILLVGLLPVGSTPGIAPNTIESGLLNNIIGGLV